MTREDRLERDLQRYYDGELGRWGRWRMERRLRASAALRERLEELHELGDLLREIELEERPQERPELWWEVGPALAAIDNEVSASRGRGARRLSAALSGWRPLAGATVATAAAMLFLLYFQAPVPENAQLGVAGSVGDGALRYLKTDGRPVVVSQEHEGVTIIWLMDEPAGA